ncbi:MAG: cupin domain-containing protein [Alcanivorax sp.]|uniref:cupin domain-containing protein n=1 Tax=Alcanivorax sp. TaxID=1872427 RepID=UPI003C507D32
MLKKYATPALLLGMALNVTGCSTASHAQHNAAHVTSPDQYRVLLENDQVLVLEMVLEPGESDRPHDHRDETVYFQKGGSLRITLPGGDAMDVTVPDGHVMWHEAWSHQVTNTGNQPVMAIIVEEKP